MKGQTAMRGFWRRTLVGAMALLSAGCYRQPLEVSSESISQETSSAAVITKTQKGLVHWQEDGSFSLFSYGEKTQFFSLAEYLGEDAGIVQEGAKVTVEYLAEDAPPYYVIDLKLISPPPDWMEYRDRAKELVSGMSLEEKVGQMFFIRCPAVDAAGEIAAYHPGGVLMFGQDFKGLTAEMTKEKISSYQEASEIPLLIGVDEEGGTVVRVSSNPLLRESRFNSPQQLFLLGGMSAIIADAEEKSRLLLSLGINVNFAPVCDVSTTPTDFIYSRTLGKDAANTAVYVGVVTEVMKKEGIGCVLKHFPGYGNNLDTHTGVVYDYRPWEIFETSDFLPFQAGIQSGAGCILVSHNIVSVMDSQYPASLSPKVHQILRDKLEFQGVIITDDLAMDAVQMYTEGGDAAVQAVTAENDMLISTSYSKQISAVLTAVQDGLLEESRIDESVVRILCWKMSLGLIEGHEP